MGEHRQCPECRFDLKADDSACPFCGVALETVPRPSAASRGWARRPALKACPDCGAKVSARAESCPQCGCPPEGKRRPTRPTGGTLVIGGRDVSTLTPPEMAKLRNQTIGFVFQSFHLLARTTAQDNVALPLVYRGVGRRERRARAAEMLDRVGLAHRVGHRPNQMSGGEQQRVAIARALVTGPSVLLADEPTGNLDTTTGQSVLALLESLNADGVAVVLVTHDREVAERAHRQIVMRDGLIVEPAPAAPDPGDGTA